MSEKTHPSSEEALSSVDNSYLPAYIVLGFIPWMLLVSWPISGLFFDSDPPTLVRTALLIGYGPFCYWLYFAKAAPGIPGVNKALLAAASFIYSTISAIPERIRFFIMLPVFAIAALGLIHHVLYLIASDEASQKRALYATYDRNATVQWFHSGDRIDVFVFSPTINRQFTPETTSDHGEVGVHLLYDGELMDLRGDSFRTTLTDDLQTAKAGGTDTIAKSIVGVYDADLTPLGGVMYYGAFGVTGVGFMEILICASTLLIVIVSLYARPATRTSGFLLGTSLLFVIFIAGGHQGADRSQAPELLTEMVTIDNSTS